MVFALMLCLGSTATADDKPATNTPGGVAAVVPIAMIASRPSGDVRLDIGYGGEFGVGLRVNRITGRIVMGASMHKIEDGGNLVLGDSLTVESKWDITWIGVDGQYSLRPGHRGQPFLTLGISGAFLTHGQNDNVEGWRLSAGGGYEYALSRGVSLVVQGQVDQLRVNKAKAAGQPIDLPEPFDETVLSLKVGFNLKREM